VPQLVVYHFSLTYFIVDSVAALSARKWGMLLAHHIPALGLFSAEGSFPLLFRLRYASKVVLIEITTPLLTRWRRTRRKCALAHGAGGGTPAR
jgi:hypothetical protein